MVTVVNRLTDEELKSLIHCVDRQIDAWRDSEPLSGDERMELQRCIKLRAYLTVQRNIAEKHSEQVVVTTESEVMP